MGRNRKKHKKKVIKSDVKDIAPIVSQMVTSGAAEKTINKSVNWKKMEIMTTGKVRRVPRYV